MAIKDRFKNLIYTINKSGDLTADFEKHLDNIKDTNILHPHKKKSWLDLINAVSQKNGISSSQKDIVDSITGDLSTLQPSQDRIKLYKNIMEIKSRIPIVSRTLRIWADNILSPDDINKKSLNVISDKEDIEGTEADIDTLKNEFQNILKKTDIDKHADDLIQNTLLLGDYFIEITSQSEIEKEVLGQVIKEEVIHLEDADKNLKEHEIKISYSKTAKIKDNNVYNIDLSKNELREDVFNIPNPSNLMVPDYEDDNEENPQIFDNDSEENEEDEDYSNIILKFHHPKHIIKIQKNDLCLGYLFVEAEEKISYYNNSPIQKDNSENTAFDLIIQKIYNMVAYNLSYENINRVPDELKSVLVDILKHSGQLEKINVRFIPESNMVHFKIPSLKNDPYGESMFADLEFTFKLYLARMVASTIYRISRAGKHLVFTVDVSGTRDAAGRIENVKRAVKSREVTASDLDNIESIPSIVSTFEDYYLPAKDGKKYVELDSIEMGSYGQDRQEEDKSLIKNILTGIEIPPSYLGIEEFNSTKATLAQESMIFARSVIRYQKMFSEYFTELAHKIYIASHSEENIVENYTDIRITFMPPRGIITESLSKMYSDIKDIYTILEELGVPKDRILRKFLPEYDFDEFYLEELEKGKNEKPEIEEDLFGGGELEAPTETPPTEEI